MEHRTVKAVGESMVAAPERGTVAEVFRVFLGLGHTSVVAGLADERFIAAKAEDNVGTSAGIDRCARGGGHGKIQRS